MTEGFTNLVEALNKQFSAKEAQSLAKLLSCSFRTDSIIYEDIELDDKVKDDIILIACEERILLPMKSMRGSAWEDRILNFTEDERYHMPRIVRFLVVKAEETGQWITAEAIGIALEEAGEPNVKAMVSYLEALKTRAPRYELEVGVMQAVGSELSLEMDMHDTLDRFVRCGIVSPRTQRSLHTGFSKYEINPCLYWKY
jgi:hypothetical protein